MTPKAVSPCSEEGLSSVPGGLDEYRCHDLHAKGVAEVLFDCAVFEVHMKGRTKFTSQDRTGGWFLYQQDSFVLYSQEHGLSLDGHMIAWVPIQARCE